MRMRFRRFALGTVLAVTAAGWSALAGPSAPPATRPTPEPVDYARDIRPILATQCLACHGSDDQSRKANLRLDTRVDATAPRGGFPAIVPGNPAKSTVIQRIRTTGTLRMPPASSGHAPTPQQVRLLERWIREGARYTSHWAFTPPSRPAVPKIVGSRTAIDAFVAQRLGRSGLALSPPADRRTLARRVALDLTGLPLPIADMDAFLADKRPGAYERLVDKLLSSPHFGERLARPWLDIGRYADSAGYGSDPLRPNLWPWRDWLIDAFNRNVPYDRFTLQMLAGDLLPGATEADRLATAFHRNTMTNTEGGTSDEEFRMAAVKDRAAVTAQAWMGLTVQCAACHNHKYDPIAQADFYALTAFFNQTEDNDQPDERPTMATVRPSEATRAAQLDVRIADLERKVAAETRSSGAMARYVRVSLPASGDFLMLAEVEVLGGGANHARGKSAKQSSTDYGGGAERAVDGNRDGNYAANSVTHTRSESNPWWEVDLGATVPVDSVVLYPRTDAHVGRLKDLKVTLFADDRRPVTEMTATGAFSARRDVTVVETPNSKALAAARAERMVIPTVNVPVMKELPDAKHRKTRILTLGNYLQPGKEVAAAVPASFGRLPRGTKADRLALARWLMSKSNPLTARVAVNRIWSVLFGRGLVETEEDFGTQGSLPTHPELLDWLAVEFRDNGWDTKRLIRTIVLSDTYRQSSRTTPDRLAKDPRAALLSRYPRRRLDAETVRDQALAISGLLSPKIGGPSVYPPQPEGLWQAAFNGDRSYPTSMGEDRYRRGLYTFWRRTVPHPSMAAFDAPSRESCTLRRQPTNTPLQALVTLNDPIYIEMARALGKRIVKEAPQGFEARLWYGLRVAASGQVPSTTQIAALARLWKAERDRLAADPDSAAKLAGSDVPADQRAEVGAWTVVGNVLLNLDAVLTVG